MTLRKDTFLVLDFGAFQPSTLCPTMIALTRQYPLRADADVGRLRHFPTLSGAELSYWRSMMALQDRFHGGNSPRNGGTSLRAQRGFSLMELMITLAIVLIMTTVTLVTMQPAMKQARDTNAYDTTLMALRSYRQKAIAQRQRYIVAFTAPGTITISYWGIAVPVNPAPVVVQTLTLPPDIQFQVQAGMPNSAATVPDGFGSGITAIDFGQGLGAGSQNAVMFMPDGTSQDAAGLGNYNSGVLYLGRTGELQSMRAITVFGTTGRVRGWRLVQQAGGPTWVQQ